MDKVIVLLLCWLAFAQAHATGPVVNPVEEWALEARAYDHGVNSQRDLDLSVFAKKHHNNTITKTTTHAKPPDKYAMFGFLMGTLVGCAVAFRVLSGRWCGCSSENSFDDTVQTPLLSGRLCSGNDAMKLKVKWSLTGEYVATVSCLPHETVKDVKLCVEGPAETPAWLLKVFRASGEELQDCQSMREVGGTEILLDKDDVQVNRQRTWQAKWDDDPQTTREELVQQLATKFPNLQDAVEKVASSNLPSELFLNFSSATDEFVQDIKQTFPKLKAINVSNTQVSYECVQGFVRYYPQLEHIVLDKYPVSDTDVEDILQKCPNLNFIKIHQTNVSPAGVSRLESAGFKEDDHLCLQAMHNSLDGEDMMCFTRHA